MEDLLSHLSGVIAVVLLVLANGFFVAVEFAIVRSHVTKLRAPELQSKFGTRSSLKLIEELDLGLSATQLGITVASLVLGWYGERILAQIFENLLHGFGDTTALVASHAVATTLALLLVTFMHVVIGELAAKSLAIRYPEETLRALAPLMLFFTQLFRPAIFVLNGAANLFLGLFGLKTASESERVHTTGELSMLISHSTEYGVLDKSEEEMLKGIFGFSETVAREVMTPRTDLVTISHTASFQQVIKTVKESGFSRFPVVGEGVDDVIGILLARDILSFVPEYIESKAKSFDIRRLLRECYFIPGTKPIDDLLNELKRRKLHMAIVLDEHGGVDGAVTMEDLIEEIVGDIYDESDAPDKELVFEADGDVLVDGGLLVEDVNERLKLKIPEGDYDTIAGFIFSALGRMSVTGDALHVNGKGLVSINGEIVAADDSEASSNDNHKDEDEEVDLCDVLLTVERVAGNRIETVRIHRIVKEPEAEAEPAPAALPAPAEAEGELPLPLVREA